MLERPSIGDTVRVYKVVKVLFITRVHFGKARYELSTTESDMRNGKCDYGIMLRDIHIKQIRISRTILTERL